jgi:hypothetical protein
MGKGYLSYTMALILQVIDHGYRYGFDVMTITGLASGTVYPALRRLEDAGKVGAPEHCASRTAPTAQVLRSHQTRPDRVERRARTFPAARADRATRNNETGAAEGLSRMEVLKTKP